MQTWRKPIENAYILKTLSVKLTDCDAENSETQVWLEYAYSCGYLDLKVFNSLTEKSLEVGKLLNYMMRNPNKFL